MIKVGLIGCGGIGSVHAECWLSMSEEVQLVAVADKNTQRAQKFVDRCGAKIYADGKNLIDNEELDVIDICLPTFLHAEYVIYASKKVKNIIVEKPVCLYEEEAKRLLEVQEQTGVLVQVAHVLRFSDDYRYLKEVVKSGKYGKVIAGYFARISPRPMWMKGHDDVDRTGTMALDMHIHDADFVRYLMEGEPDEVSSWSVRDAKGVIQHIWTSYQYGTSRLVAEGSWDYPLTIQFAETFRVRLEAAALVLDEKGMLTVYPENGESFMPELKRERMDFEINVSDIAPYLNEMRYFLEVIKGGERNGIASLSEAVASFRLVRDEIEHCIPTNGTYL